MIEEARNIHPFHQWLDSEPWKKSKSIGLTGLKGSSKAYLLSLWRERIRKPLLIIAPLPRDAEILLEDLRFFQNETDDSLYLFPPWETLPYDDIPPHPEIIRERVKALISLLRDEAGMIIAPIRALMQKVLPPQDLSESTLSLAVGEEVERDQWVQF